jgi:hypothetical protein
MQIASVDLQKMGRLFRKRMERERIENSLAF